MKDITLLLLCAVMGFATDPFPSKGKSIEAFSITGWEITAKASGDLNKDGLADYALELTQKDSVQLIDTSDGIYAEDSLYYQPTALVILFKKGDAFIKAKVSYDVLPRPEGLNHCHTLEAMDITRGVLNISTHSFMSMGSWWASSTTSRYRYQNGDFYLIGKDESSYHRASGEADSYSTNYLTRKQQIKTFNMFHDSVKTTEEWKKLPKEPLQKM